MEVFLMKKVLTNSEMFELLASEYKGEIKNMKETNDLCHEDCAMCDFARDAAGPGSGSGDETEALRERTIKQIRERIIKKIEESIKGEDIKDM